MTGEILAFLILNSMAVIGALVQTFVQGQRLSRQREAMDNQRDSLIHQMAEQAFALKDQINASALERQKEMQALSLEHQREIREISTDNAEKLGYYKAKVERLEDAVEAGHIERESYNQVIDELKTELLTKAEENEAMRKDFTALERRVRELEDKLMMLSNELDEERKARKHAERERDEAREKAERLAVELADVKKERDELKAQLEAERLEEAVTDEQIT